MPEHDKIKVWIEVAGKPLDEYEVSTKIPSPLNRRVECTIPSEANRNFKVGIVNGSKWPRETQIVHCNVKIYLDGKLCRALVLDDEKTFIEDARISDSTCRLLKFASIQLTDGATPAEANYQEMSTIRVEVYFVRKEKGTPDHDDMEISETGNLDEGPLLETLKKEGGNRSALGDVVNSEKSQVTIRKITRLPTTNFVFTHAPRTWLQAQEIIPRDEDGVQFLTSEEADQYRQFRKKMKAGKKKVRDEVKSEQSQLSVPQHTVIDLTLD